MPEIDTARVQQLMGWLDQLKERDRQIRRRQQNTERVSKYSTIRRAEQVQSVTISIGQEKKPLRGVRLAPDLVLTRHHTFYRVIDGHAVEMPALLVAEQYELAALVSGFDKATRAQPRSRK